MSVDVPEQSQPGAVAPATPKQNVFERLAGVLFTPAETFADIARMPGVVAPLLLLLVIGYATTLLVAPKMDYSSIVAEQERVMKERNPNLSNADLARAGRLTVAFARVMGYFGPVLMVAWWAIVAGVLLLAFRMMGGEGRYAQAFSATLYAWVPLTLYGIILTIVVLARGSFDPTVAATIVKSNPAFLVEMKEHPALYTFLAALDVFTIWTLVLLIFGFAALSRSTRQRAAAIVLSLWGVMILVRVGWVALFAPKG